MANDEMSRSSQRSPGADEADEIRITATYKRDGCVAMVRSQFFDPRSEIQDLLTWSKEFEQLNIELVRVDLEVE